MSSVLFHLVPNACLRATRCCSKAGFLSQTRIKVLLSKHRPEDKRLAAGDGLKSSHIYFMVVLCKEPTDCSGGLRGAASTTGSLFSFFFYLFFFSPEQVRHGELNAFEIVRENFKRLLGLDAGSGEAEQIRGSALSLSLVVMVGEHSSLRIREGHLFSISSTE